MALRKPTGAISVVPCYDLRKPDNQGPRPLRMKTSHVHGQKHPPELKGECSVTEKGDAE